MRRYLTIMDHLPAVVFLAIAAFFASRILLAFFPEEPVAWQVYLNIAPFWRELGVLYETPTLTEGAFMATGFYTIGAICLLLVHNRHMHRARFFYFHLSLIALIYCMNDEKVWIASNSAGGVGTEFSLLPNFSNVSPVSVWLFFGVVISCLATHRDMILRSFRRSRRFMQDRD